MCDYNVYIYIYIYIGKDENNKFSLHNSPSRNDKHLVEFSLENLLVCLNTTFIKGKQNFHQPK